MEQEICLGSSVYAHNVICTAYICEPQNFLSVMCVVYTPPFVGEVIKKKITKISEIVKNGVNTLSFPRNFAIGRCPKAENIIRRFASQFVNTSELIYMQSNKIHKVF